MQVSHNCHLLDLKIRVIVTLCQLILNVVDCYFLQLANRAEECSKAYHNFNNVIGKPASSALFLQHKKTVLKILPGGLVLGEL